MDWLKDITTNYLSSWKSDYAILINGDWGSGKTYYVKTVLRKHIDSIKFDETHNFSTIYISLFGLTTAEELSDKILIQLNPGLKKIVTVGSGIINKIIEKKFGFNWQRS